MTVRKMTVPVLGSTPAALVLPQPLTLEALSQLEEGLAGTLAKLRREVGDCDKDPGKLEYESWMQHLRTALR